MSTTQAQAATDSFHYAREAAERVFHAENGAEADYVEPADEGAAGVAVRHLRTLFEMLPGRIRDALESARASGELISRDRLQGVAEVFQNADDLGATEVAVQLRANDLLFAHNGSPVTLSHVMALATPWLSTKAEDASATGRFGIGLTALRALSPVLEVHCRPYRLRIGDPTLDVADPVSPAPRIGGPGWTVLRVPLEAGALSLPDLEAWFARWDDSALIFLRSISQVTLHDGAGRVVRTLRLNLGSETPVPGVRLRVDTPVLRQEVLATDGRVWLTYRAEPPVPSGARRTHKATSRTTPIAIALQRGLAGRGHIHAGLPLMTIDLPCRINAQFDPLTSRTELADTKWNHTLYGLVAELWAEAVLDLFAVDPASAWQAVPLLAEGDPSSDVDSPSIAAISEVIAAAARTTLASRLAFIDEDGAPRPLRDLAVESAELQGVIAPREVAELAGLPAALPMAVRDTGGRWRDVLDDWRTAGADLPQEVGVEDALVLLSDESRSPVATLRLTRAGLDAGLQGALAALACVVTEDGQHLVPPDHSAAIALAAARVPLAEDLGIVKVLHSTYAGASVDAKRVLAWLRERGSILEADDPSAVLGRLAAAGRTGHRTAVLSNGQIQRLRDVFETLPIDEREAVGRDVGRAVRLYAYRHARRGKIDRIEASPAEAYLPAAIDREPESFAVAAGETPGLIWLDGRYRDVLRSPAGREGLGAQRFLRLLGAETAPRLGTHPALVRRYQSDRRRGLSSSHDAAIPTGRRAALRRLDATYTLEDRVSPDLLAVASSIALERRAGRRRRRAAALLSTLGRAWERLSEFTEVDAVSDYGGWRHQGRVKAFWLWQASSVTWIDNASGKPSRGEDLRVRTDATLAIYGRDPAGYLHPDLDGGNRRNPLSALGVTGEPTTEELLDRLRELRSDLPSDTEAEQRQLKAETAIVYQALSPRVGTVGGRSEFPRAQLQRAFSQGTGLIYTRGMWRKPAEVRTGPPVFSDYMPFVPPVPNTERLWNALGVRAPNVEDCLDVLRRIARSAVEPSNDDESVLLETFRLVVDALDAGELAERERRAFRELPLWTTSGWVRRRPVYTADDPALAEALGRSAPVWRPGGDPEQFRSLIETLRVTRLEPSSFTVVESQEAIDDEEGAKTARLAMRHLRADLERNDPAVAAGILVAWHVVEDLGVRELPGLALRSQVMPLASLPALEVSAWFSPADRVLFVKDVKVLARADGGGRAIASLFSSRHRHVAQAWRAAWDAAEDGREAERLRTADEREKAEAAATEAAIRARTEAFRGTTAERAQTQTRGAGAKGPGSSAANGESTASGEKARQQPPRLLVDASTLRLTNARGRVEPASAGGGGTGEPRGRGRRNLPPPRPGGARPNSVAAPRGYTEAEKEALGLELVRRLLATDDAPIVDIRGQRGVGADAVDDLQRFYELKVSAGDEPNTIALTEAELQRALTTPEYFLIVVSGLEGDDARPRVRVFVDPLRQLRSGMTGTVTLSGVREVGGLVYEFEPDDT
ncbi:MAG: hypothetical protein R3C39_10810 [Dehalococcoidia bacterium]